jgi:4-oxalocrotonate tautomerase family enzyme
MPIVRIDLLEGRTSERKADPIRGVTAAVRPEQVRMLLSKTSPEHWGIGGETMAERIAPTAGKDTDRDHA